MLYKVFGYVVALFITAVNLWIFVQFMQPELQRASDRICVPLYNETGYECCQQNG
jgi:hypothetical protein